MRNTVILITLLALTGACIAGCGGGGGSVLGLSQTAGLSIKVKLPSAAGKTRPTLEIRKAPSVSDVTSVTVRLSGSEYKTIQQSFPVTNGRGTIFLDSLAPAAGLLLQIIVYSSNSVPLFQASTTVDLKPGEIAQTDLVLTSTGPDTVTLSVGDYSSGSNVDLAWTRSTETYFGSYRIYRATEPGVTESSTLLDTITTNTTTSRRISGLEFDTTYYFRVFVVGLSGWTAGGNEVSVTTIDPDPAVLIPDSSLQQALRTALGIPTGDISVSDLAALGDLDASSSDISDLTGLEYCTALINLNLSDNQINDISILENLINLATINLADNLITDITPLVNNTGLGTLNAIDLTGNSLDEDDLADVEALEARNVTIAQDIDINEVVTFAESALEQAIRDQLAIPTGNVTENDLLLLTSVVVTDAGITDISGLEYCTALLGLDLSDNQITDISPLAGCVNLLGLGLSNNRITDISVLENLTDLVSLDISNNQITDISPLVDNTGLGAGDTINLVNNSLDENDLTDILSIETLGATITHSIGGGGLLVVFPDSGLEQKIRETISKATGDIFDVDLAALSSLDATSSSISDLTGLEQCPVLGVLELAHNQVTDIEALADITTLTGLSLFNNPVSDISALENLPNLVILGLNNTQVADITPLVNNTGINSGDLVNLTNSQVDAGDLADIQTLEARGVLVLHNITGDQAVTFDDANLEAAVRSALSKPTGDIMVSDLAGLTSLDASSSGIADISGLEYCTALTDLDLSDNLVTDISPLQSCTALITLDLTDNQVSDIEALVVNTGLGVGSTVTLTGNQLESADLTDILALTARGVTVNHDVSGGEQAVTFNDANLEAGVRSALSKPSGDILQSDLAGLVSLSVSSTSVSDLSGLEYCTGLVILNLSDNQVSDITSLQFCTSLVTLDLSKNLIDDITPLVINYGLGTGDTVVLSDNLLDPDDLPGIATLEENGVVVTLAVSFTDSNLEQAVRDAISKPSGDILHSDLAGLTTLTASSEGIGSISGLEFCTGLTALDLSNNEITDISKLSYLTTLLAVDLSDNEITDISSFFDLPTVTGLELGDNQISDISAIQSLTTLIALGLGGNQVSDLFALQNLFLLQELVLTGNQVSDIGLLVLNPGLGAGDSVTLTGNLLDAGDLANIQTLEARGVTVTHDVSL